MSNEPLARERELIERVRARFEALRTQLPAGRQPPAALDRALKAARVHSQFTTTVSTPSDDGEISLRKFAMMHR